jgi:hypothetical protein
VKLDELPPELNPYKPPPPPPAKWYEKWWVWTAAVGGAAVVAVTVGVGVSEGTKDRILAFNPDVTLTGDPKPLPMAITF